MYYLREEVYLKYKGNENRKKFTMLTLNKRVVVILIFDQADFSGKKFKIKRNIS